jgi:alkyl sulfatase BDS1-like metallo-beta-lactamase superfamily hydrolase
MTESLLDRAARFIDGGVYEGPFANNPMDASLHEVADDIALVCSFSHVWTLRTAEGLTAFDTSLAALGPPAVEAIRRWSDAPFTSLVYTHGHIDHVGGAPAFLADAEGRGDERPRIVAHENAPRRFARYVATHGYNLAINRRQAGGAHIRFPDRFEAPDDVFRDELSWTSGDLTISLRHDRGETDDHAWAWIPEHRAVLCGDLFIWVFPNAGNPQKVQRYAADWAAALRRMAALEPELLLPAHGLPIAGRDRIATVLDSTAGALEHLVTETVAMMNAGATLDEIVHTVRVPEAYADLPYLRATYDEPEFVVRNIWRLYGGWYDGNPARLKPAPDAAVAAEVAALAGGPEALAARALTLTESGDLRLACQLVEWAAQAAPDEASVHETRAVVYRARRKAEASLMAKGIYGTAAGESEARLDD